MARSRTALITGITGQDGSYLAELLLAKGYTVYGVVRRTSTTPLERIAHLQSRVRLLTADLLDEHSLREAVRLAAPDEVYNLAAQSFVQASWQHPVLTGEFTALGVTRLLEAVRAHAPGARVYQAGSSEQFGAPDAAPQNEDTPFRPRSPYGVAKAYGHLIVAAYRRHHGLFAVTGVLYNHESPRRGLEFVPRKICAAAARIRLGLDRELVLGDLEARRDWGYAADFVDAMWRMLQRPEPSDYVVGTGRLRSVRDLCAAAFGHVGLDYREHVRVDPALVRPPEAVPLVADPSRARRELGWVPAVSFDAMVAMMVDADIARCAATGC
jgi:GDPmannose 4,6-dehydratase